MSRSWTFVVAGLHAMSAVVPGLIFPELTTPMMIAGEYSDRCLNGDAFCGFALQFINLLVFCFALIYLSVGFATQQRGAMMVAITAKFLATFVLVNGYINGVLTEMGLIMAVIDFSFGMAFLWVYMTPSKTRR